MNNTRLAPGDITCVVALTAIAARASLPTLTAAFPQVGGLELPVPRRTLSTERAPVPEQPSPASRRWYEAAGLDSSRRNLQPSPYGREVVRAEGRSAFGTLYSG